ncbi:MAG: acyl-CoA dehydrogenase family protein [Acidobacteria bacterium]|nr:acyl-CoA dehydrogenase family protein [Acidobacteriota bacterium]
MSFDLSEEQRQLQQMARDFAREHIVPVAQHHDETGEFPSEVCRKAFEQGLMNPHIPEEYGGAGLGILDESIMIEELAAACSGITTAIMTNTLSQAPVIMAGTPEQKRQWLQPMTERLSFCAYCVTEPGAGSDVAGIRTTARKDGDTFVLNGEKMWITGAEPAEWYYVLAYTDPSQKTRGMSAFVVPRNSPGVQVGKKEKNMGQRASDTRAITFENVRVPAGNMLGKEGDGFKITMSAFDRTRPPISASAVGLARAAMEHAIKYAQERTAFGVPIAMHEGVSFMIADMAKDIEAARLLVWQAAWTIDQGRRNTKLAAFAKAFAADTAMRVATDAVQVFGGYGYNTEYPVEKLMRDAKIFQIYEGTSQIQRLIIAKEIFQR